MSKTHSQAVLDEFWFHMNDKDTEKFNNEYEETLRITFHDDPKNLTSKQHDQVFYELLERYYKEANNGKDSSAD